MQAVNRSRSVVTKTPTYLCPATFSRPALAASTSTSWSYSALPLSCYSPSSRCLPRPINSSSLSQPLTDSAPDHSNDDVLIVKIGVNSDPQGAAWAIVNNAVKSLDTNQGLEMWSTGWNQVYLAMKAVTQAQQLATSKGVRLTLAPFNEELYFEAQFGKKRMTHVVFEIIPYEDTDLPKLDGVTRVNATTIKTVVAFLAAVNLTLHKNGEVVVEMLGEKSVSTTVKALLKMYDAVENDDELCVTPLLGQIASPLAAKQGREEYVDGMLLHIKRQVVAVEDSE